LRVLPFPLSTAAYPGQAAATGALPGAGRVSRNANAGNSAEHDEKRADGGLLQTEAGEDRGESTSADIARNLSFLARRHCVAQGFES
jgi:hypothetical protein